LLAPSLAKRHPKRNNLEVFLESLIREHSVVAIVLFGSVATGEYDIHSDFDLVIVSDDMGSNWMERNQAAQRISPGLINSFVLTTAEFNELFEQMHLLILDAIDQGKVILDTNGIIERARSRLNKWKEKGYLRRETNGWTIEGLE